MSDITILGRLITGALRNVDISSNTLVTSSVKVGGSSVNTELTKTILDNLVALQNGTDFTLATNAHTHDGRYFTETELGSVTSGSEGTKLIGDYNSYSHFTPASATLKATLTAIDGVLGAASSALDGSFRINNTADPTKQIAFSAAGIAHSALRTITMPDADVNLGSLTNDNISASAAIALTKLATVTASKVLVSDSSGNIAASSVSTTTLGYLDATSSVQTQLNAKIASTEKGAASGVATLDAGGKIPAAQLPSSVMEFKGAWNATTNVPVLADGGAAIKASKIIQDLTYQAKTAGAAGNDLTIEYIDTSSGGLSFTEIAGAVVVDFGGATPTATQISVLAFTLVDVSVSGTGSNVQTAPVAEANLAGGQDAASTGDVYRCSVAGSHDFGSGSITFGIGDWAMYNGSIWQHSPATDAVTSVNTKAGAVTLVTDDIAEDGEPVNLWFTTSRAKTAAVVNSTSGSETDQAPSVSAIKSYISASPSASAPLMSSSEVAGEAFAATTLRAVRFAKAADAGYVAGRMYKSSVDASATDDFFAIGLVYPATSKSAGDALTVVEAGLISAPSHGFTIGQPLYLTTGAALTNTAPSAANSAVVRMGFAKDSDTIFVQVSVVGVN